ncbi:hypothetical protein [[Eubacterium] cellulosolvens]
MKSGVFAGAFAGLVSGVITVIIIIIGGSFGLWGFIPTPVIELTTIFAVLTTFFGAIFGMIYAKFYGSIPSKGVIKGLIFGLMIWFVKDIAAGAYAGFAMGQYAVGINLIVGGSYMWFIYGLVLGYLYKPTK